MVYLRVRYVCLQFILMTLGSMYDIPGKLEGLEKSSRDFHRATIKEKYGKTLFFHNITAAEGNESLVGNFDRLQQTPQTPEKVIRSSRTANKNAQSSNPVWTKSVDGSEDEVPQNVATKRAKRSEKHSFETKSDNRTNQEKVKELLGECSNLNSELAEETVKDIPPSGQVQLNSIIILPIQPVNLSSAAHKNSHANTKPLLGSTDADRTTTGLKDFSGQHSSSYGSPRATLNCRCGVADPEDRIVGGTFTTILQHPWMVQLMLPKTDFFFCAGSVINDLYILTAAHCVVGSRPSQVVVRLGHTGPKDVGFKVGVRAIIKHARYIPTDFRSFDIALLKLKRRIRFAKRVWPICVWKKESYNRDIGTIAGWGSVFESGPQSPTLKRATVKILEYKSCRKMSNHPASSLQFRILCGRRRNSNICHGDSGGPMTSFNGVRRYQVGITSWGRGCAVLEYPAIFTRVASYYGWIKQRTRDGRYCAV